MRRVEVTLLSESLSVVITFLVDIQKWKWEVWLIQPFIVHHWKKPSENSLCTIWLGLFMVIRRVSCKTVPVEKNFIFERYI